MINRYGQKKDVLFSHIVKLVAVGGVYEKRYFAWPLAKRLLGSFLFLLFSYVCPKHARLGLYATNT